MKKIAVFKNPEEVALANDFLAKNPPEQVSTYDDKIVINYDDQTYPPAYKAEEIRGLMLSNEKQMMTSQISLDVAEVDLVRYKDDLAKLETTEISETNLSELSAKVEEAKLVEEPADLSKADLKKWRTDNQKKISDAMKLASDEGKRVSDLKSDRTKKMEEFKQIIQGITEANYKLGESISRFASRNAVMQKHLDALNLN